MKKKVYIVLLIISLIPVVLLIIGLINSFINGYGSDPEVVSSFLLPKEYGFKGVKMHLYYTFNPNLLGAIFIPLYSVCLLYQVIYFIKLRKIK